MWPDTQGKKTCPWPSADTAAIIGTVLTGPFAALPNPGHPDRAANDDDHPTPIDVAPTAAKISMLAPALATLRWARELPRRLIAGVLAWRQRQILKESLLAMDRHQLADIGLTPEDIPAVVEGRFRRHHAGHA